MQTRLLLGLVLVLALSGCAQLTVHSTVTESGTISEYDVQVNTSRTVYGFLEQSAEDDGYSSVRESILSDVDESMAGNVAYDEEFDGDEVWMRVTLTDFDPPADSGIEVTESDGTLTYVDTTFYNESYQPDEYGSLLSGLALDYYLTMPGEITDSNANTVDGDTAEWHETGPDAFEQSRIEATSDLPITAAVPGFGTTVGLLAIAATFLALALRRGRR